MTKAPSKKAPALLLAAGLGISLLLACSPTPSTPQPTVPANPTPTAEPLAPAEEPSPAPTPQPEPTAEPVPAQTPDPLAQIVSLEFTLGEQRFFNRIGEVRTLTFRALDAQGQEVPIQANQLEWSTSRPQDIPVTETGEATAVGDYGYSEITIKVPGSDIQASVRMTISDGEG